MSKSYGNPHLSICSRSLPSHVFCPCIGRPVDFVDKPDSHHRVENPVPLPRGCISAKIFKFFKGEVHIFSHIKTSIDSQWCEEIFRIEWSLKIYHAKFLVVLQRFFKRDTAFFQIIYWKITRRRYISLIIFSR